MEKEESVIDRKNVSRENQRTKFITALSVVCLVLFLLATAIFPFKDKIFSSLYPKIISRAQNITSSSPDPSELTAAAVSPSQINITWKNPLEEEVIVSYEVYRNGTQIAEVEGTSFGESGLYSGRSYEYMIAAKDREGKVVFTSNKVSIATQAVVKTGQLRGKINADNGELLRGVKVVLDSGLVKESVVSNSLGVYVFDKLTAGTYTLQFSSRGYESKSLSVTVNEDSETQSDVVLTRSIQ